MWVIMPCLFQVCWGGGYVRERLIQESVEQELHAAVARSDYTDDTSGGGR